MNGSILDTNIIIDFFRNKQNVVDKILVLNNIYVPITAVGELYYGAYLSKKTETHIDKINIFLKKVNILQIDEDTAKVYGEIKFKLKLRGKPIPENDIWIASITIQHNLELLSNDKHFKYIEDLKVNEILD